jgi:hypothetical protein
MFLGLSCPSPYLLVEFESDEYRSAVAANVEEAEKLIEAGFEYVCSHNETMLFRKRKQRAPPAGSRFHDLFSQSEGSSLFFLYSVTLSLV